MARERKRPTPAPKNVTKKKAQTSEVKTSSSKRREIDTMGVIYLSDVQKKRWASFAQPTRKVHVTKVIDLATLTVLDMDDVTKKLFRKVGMEAFLSKKVKTYVRCTYEFLSTLKREMSEVQESFFALIIVDMM